MKLDLKKYFSNEDEVPEKVSFTADLSDVELSGVYPFVSPVAVSVGVRGSNGAVLLDFQVSYDFEIPCDRCMELIREKKTASFSHTVILSQEDSDEGDYIRIPSGELDAGELVREDIILSLPYRFLCREDCKGLCPVCGKNLNTGSCGCRSGKVDPRLEILKKLIDDKA